MIEESPSSPGSGEEGRGDEGRLFQRTSLSAEPFTPEARKSPLSYREPYGTPLAL